VLTFFAQDTGTLNLVYANADICKATQNREPIAFCDHWKAVSGFDPKMLIMDQKVTTQAVLGELDAPGVKSATLRMRSASLMRHINGAPTHPSSPIRPPRRHHHPLVADRRLRFQLSSSQGHDSLHGNPRTCQAGIPRCLRSLNGHRIIHVPY
jgi:hypothetical protein